MPHVQHSLSKCAVHNYFVLCAFCVPGLSHNTRSVGLSVGWLSSDGTRGWLVDYLVGLVVCAGTGWMVACLLVDDPQCCHDLAVVFATFHGDEAKDVLEEPRSWFPTLDVTEDFPEDGSPALLVCEPLTLSPMTPRLTRETCQVQVDRRHQRCIPRDDVVEEHIGWRVCLYRLPHMPILSQGNAVTGTTRARTMMSVQQNLTH